MSQNTKVLVVEDEALIRMVMVDYLADEGFDVLEAGNADEAIAVLEEHSNVHVLFTDIDMPGSMDGLRLSAFVRNRWPPVRIVVTSGHKIVDVLDLPDGGVFYAKPYDHVQVAQTFRQLLSG